MSEPAQEILLMIGLFAGGTLAGRAARHAPLLPWVALLLPLVFAPLGVWLTMTFC